MSDQGNTITKVYDLQMLGGKDAYNTLSGINQLFKEMAANKVSLNGTFNLNVDTSKLEGINRSFSQLIASNKDLIANIKVLTTEMSKFGQVGQQMASSISASMGKINIATLQNIVGFQKFQATISAGSLTAENYGTILLALQQRTSELTAAISDNASAAIEVRKQYNQGQITQEEYNAVISQITTSQFELKAALQATGKEISTLTDLWNISASSAAENNQQVAANKVMLQEHNIELKQQAKLMMAAEGSIDQMSIKLGLLRDEYRQLSEAERESSKGRGMLYQIQSLDSQVKALDRSIGNSQRNVGNYGSAFDHVGSKLQQFIVRDLFRATAGFLVFNLLFEGFQKLWEAMPGKVDKSREAMQSFNDTLSKQFDEFIEIQKAINSYFDVGEAANKAAVDAAKAKGVVNGEVFQSEKEQFDAEQALRAKQVDDIVETLNKYKEIEDVFAHYDKNGDLNNVRRQIQKMGVELKMSNAEVKLWLDQIDDYVKTKSKLTPAEQKDFKLSENFDLFKKQSELKSQQYAKEQEIENAKTEMLAKQEELRYNKNIELAAQLVQVREQRRQTEEQEEINSVAKITRDVKAKYNIMYDEIHKKMLELAKQFPDDKLPADLQKKFDQILDNVGKIQKLDQQNQITAFNRTERLTAFGFNSAEAQSGAEISKFSADNSHTDYGRMSDAIDKQEEAKRKAEEKNYAEEKEQYRLHGRDTEEIDKLHQDRLKQIEQESYQERVALASQYYNRIKDEISAANDLAVEKIETETLRKINALLGGKGSDATKKANVTKQEQLGIIEAARENIENQKKLLEEANAAVERDQTSVGSATTPDQKSFAEKQLLNDQKIVADIKNNIEKSKKQILDAGEALKETDKQIEDALKTQAIDAFEQISNAYIEMLQKQEEARARHAQQALDWNKRELDSQVQSNAQKQANDKAYFIAQQSQEHERFNQQKKLAEAQAAIDYASAVIKIIASNASLGPAAPAVDAIEIAGITAIYGAKLAMMQSETYEYGGEVPSSGGQFGGRPHSQGGTPFSYGGRMFEAEAGELAIINKRSASSDHVLSVSGTPKQIASAVNSYGGGVNFAPGASMHRYEWGGSLGAQVTAPSFPGIYYATRSQAAMGYNVGSSGDIQALTEALNRHIQSTESRIDRLQVVLNPRSVQDSNNSYNKSVKVGRL